MYTYDIDTATMFDDRTHQFEKFGIPLDEIQLSEPLPRICGPTRPVAGCTSGLGWLTRTPSAASTGWRRWCTAAPSSPA